MPPRPRPVISFAPELLTLLLAGARETQTLTLPYNDAANLRQRIYQLRKSMERESHAQAEIVQKAVVRIILPEDMPTKPNHKGERIPALSHRTHDVTVQVAPKDDRLSAAIRKSLPNLHKPAAPSVAVPQSEVMRDSFLDGLLAEPETE
jgi:hypothetical protein